ncbi:MAG TPA: hypothetical protein VIX82_02970 [Solirubrobacteraceae bacterium]
MASNQILVLDKGREVTFSFEGMLIYHGGGSPGGVAHAFKVLERALPLLDIANRVERRELIIETSFGGPGARDAFELVTGAVTDGRFILDPTLARAEYGRARERFVFRLHYCHRTVLLTLREGFVSEQFIDLTRQEGRTAGEERRLAAMKADMAVLVMAAAAADVYDVA